MSRSRHARRRPRDRALQDRPPASRIAGSPAARPPAPPAKPAKPAGTIAIRIVDGAEGIILHQRLEIRPPAGDPEDGWSGRRYLLKEVFE